MIINIRIDNDTLEIHDPSTIVSGSKNYYELRAAFSPDWEGLNKYVIFPAQKCSIAMDAEDHAALPEALIAERGILTFGIIGLDSSGNLRISTNYVRMMILEGAREIHALPPSPDDNATWEGYLGKVAQEIIDKMNNATSGFLKAPIKTADIKDGAVTASKLDKKYLPVYNQPDPADGWLINWLFDDGWYLGGIKKGCGGHPPVLNNNHTSWAVLVLNGMNTEPNGINHNHRIQIAYDLPNSKLYLRRGWISENTWADKWDEIGEIPDGAISLGKLADDARQAINDAVKYKGELDLDWLVLSDDKNIHSKILWDCDIKPGWIFKASTALSKSLPMYEYDPTPTPLNISANEMIMYVGPDQRYFSSWISLNGLKAAVGKLNGAQIMPGTVTIDALTPESWNTIVAVAKDSITTQTDTTKLDSLIIPILIKEYGVTAAFRMFAQANEDVDTLTDITSRFFKAAAKSVTETYASEFYKFSTSGSTIGEKKADNADLVCTPSTNTVAGQDDYAELPLFACFDCNYTIDADTLEPVVHAVKGVYGNYDSAPTDSLVGVIQMTGWVRRTSTDTTKTVEYRAQEAEGFKPLPEAVRVSDNSVRPFVIHAKYAAGYDKNGLLSSVSGVQPVTYRPGSAGSTAISHNGQIALWRKRGNQYAGSSLCDIAFLQLMLEIKYAVLGSAQVMQGCRNYNTTLSYTAAVSESGVKRILLTEAQGNYFIVGSCVTLGSGNDRTKATCYDICDIARIVSIEDVQINSVSYKAINLDAENTFDTSEGATYIIPHPWRTGSTDAVLGNDGSPTSNTNQKEPFKLQGIEVMVGVYEALGDTTCYSSAEGYYNIYANLKAADVVSGGSGTNPVTIGAIPKTGAMGWKYIAELNWSTNDQKAYMLAQTFGAGSTTGYRAAHYHVAEGTSGNYEWLAFGDLGTGGCGGLAYAGLYYGLDGVNWSVGTRACGSGGNRGEYTQVI